MQTKTIFCLGFFALSTLVLAGCKTMDASQPSPSAGLQMAPVLPSYPNLSPNAPPPEPVEIPPQITDLQHQVWRPGHWAYENDSFNWVPGAIMRKPSFTAIWVPDHWDQHEFGWAFVCGHWQ